MTPLASITLATVTALGALSLPQSAAATGFGSNLIVNGNAEADVGSTTGNSIGSVTGFTTTGDFTVIQYNAGGGYPTATDPGPADRGANFFGGGVLGYSVGEQTLNISDIASTVDTGLTGFSLSAFLGGYATQDDNAVLALSFLGAGATPLGSASIGPVTQADRGGLTGLSFRQASGVLPTGTRSIVVDLQLTRVEGSSNDGYADDLSLVLTASPIAAAIPEPESWALMVAGLGALGLLRKPARQRR